MYLYYFEKIVRRYSGDYGWALPFWNWQLASENKLPAMFRDTSNPLYTPNRDPGINAGTSTLPTWAVDCSTALGDLAFTDAVEDIQAPHGNVHVTVGGWMASVPTSAQDPIFYFHHSNVDRLWNIWLAQGGGRTDPVADATWKGKTYTFFDENAKQVTMTDCDVVRAAQQLNYGYQGEPSQVNEYCTVKFIIPPWLLQLKPILQLPIPPVEVKGDKVSVPIELGQNASHVTSLAQSTAASQKLFLVLDNVEVDTQPDTLYQVYVGLSAGVAPNPKSPYYVGTFSMFGMGVRDEKTHPFMPAHFRFSIKGAVAASLRAKAKLNVTVVPVNPRATNEAVPRILASRPKGTLKIGSITVSEGAASKATQ